MRFGVDGTEIRAGVWDMSNGQALHLLKPGEPLVIGAAFSPAGWRIAAGGSKGSVQTYDCQLCGGVRQLVELARRRLARLHC